MYSDQTVTGGSVYMYMNYYLNIGLCTISVQEIKDRQKIGEGFKTIAVFMVD